MIEGQETKRSEELDILGRIQDIRVRCLQCFALSVLQRYNDTVKVIKESFECLSTSSDFELLINSN